MKTIYEQGLETFAQKYGVTDMCALRAVVPSMAMQMGMAKAVFLVDALNYRIVGLQVVNKVDDLCERIKELAA